MFPGAIFDSASDRERWYSQSLWPGFSAQSCAYPGRAHIALTHARNAGNDSRSLRPGNHASIIGMPSTYDTASTSASPGSCPHTKRVPAALRPASIAPIAARSVDAFAAPPSASDSGSDSMQPKKLGSSCPSSSSVHATARRPANARRAALSSSAPASSHSLRLMSLESASHSPAIHAAGDCAFGVFSAYHAGFSSAISTTWYGMRSSSSSHAHLHACGHASTPSAPVP